jgi:hypothetical protein
VPAPSLDRFFVALAGTALRLLRAEAQLVQQTTDMVEMVCDTEASVDQLRYATAGPQIGVVPGLFCSRDQQVAQFVLLHFGEFGTWSRMGLRRQSRHPVPLEGLFPAFDRRNMYAQKLGNFCRRFSFL